MNTITTAKPALINDGLPATQLAADGVPLSDTPITPLDLIEEPQIRTKLRLYAILSALYVLSCLVFSH